MTEQEEYKFINYYSILELPPFVSEDEMRKAYRILVKRYHPDRNPDPQARDRFLQIQRAYEILSDASRRSAFDTLLRQRLNRAKSHITEQTHTPKRPQEPVRPRERKIFIQPELPYGRPVHIIFNGLTYDLDARQVSALRHDGLLRGQTVGRDYLLLYCTRCHALFGGLKTRDTMGRLYNPYDLFPVCPRCQAISWCPADEARENSMLKINEDRRAAEAARLKAEHDASLAAARSRRRKAEEVAQKAEADAEARLARFKTQQQQKGSLSSRPSHTSGPIKTNHPGQPPLSSKEKDRFGPIVGSIIAFIFGIPVLFASITDTHDGPGTIVGGLIFGLIFCGIGLLALTAAFKS